jgi:hypothetical protein
MNQLQRRVGSRIGTNVAEGHATSILRPEDGFSRLLRNVRAYLSSYTRHIPEDCNVNTRNLWKCHIRKEYRSGKSHLALVRAHTLLSVLGSIPDPYFTNSHHVPAIVQEVTRELHIAESRAQSQGRPCGICSVQSGAGVGLTVSSASYHSSYVPYSSAILSPPI